MRNADAGHRRMGPQTEIAVKTTISEDSTGILRCLREGFEPYDIPAAFLETVLTSDTLVTRLHTMAWKRDCPSLAS